MNMFDTLKGFIFDLDGTVYLGERALSGAVETIAALRRLDRQVLFVTNKPLQPRAVYAQKLTALGIPSTSDDIITSGYVLGHYLARHLPDLRLYVIGEEPLLDELRGHNLSIVPDYLDQDPLDVIQAQDVDAVVVAFDRTLDYRKLNTAYQALLNGAHFFATNGDHACPMPTGSIPDAGATIAALGCISGRQLDLLAGKPSQLIVDVILDRLSLRPDQCLMVGDRLETDIAMGQTAGMRTAVVLSGASTRADLDDFGPSPDLVLENIGALIGALGA